MGTFLLVLLFAAAGWVFRRQLAVVAVIAYSLLTVESEYRSTARAMRRSGRRRHGA